MSGSSARKGQPRIWGLTGGIASGKSTAARLFEKAGFPVVDADQIARELSQPGGAAHDRIVARFGSADRAKIRETVFSDPTARQDLEDILHPLIASESASRMQKLADAHAGDPSGFIGIYEAALLIETGRFRDFEGLIVVDCPIETRRKRLIERDHFLPELADKILAAQTSDLTRRQAASVILDNSGTFDDLRKQVKQVAARLRLIEPPRA